MQFTAFLSLKLWDNVIVEVNSHFKGKFLKETKVDGLQSESKVMTLK